MRRILQLALLLLLPVMVWAQTYPPVGVYGPVGSKGPGFPTIFPVIITIPSDADYTMDYPDMSGSSGMLQVTCAVSLSAQRNIIVQTIFGFWWFVENLCNKPIYLEESTGAGVQILSGYAQIVGCDLTHCFTTPQGSGGTVLSVVGTAPVSCTGGANVTCAMAQANGSTNGYLASADWSTFNGKQNALGYTPAHAGANSDITSLAGLTTPLPTSEGGSGTAGGTGYRYGNGASPDTYNPTLPQPAIEHCWSIQPGVAAVSTMLGAVYYAPNGLTAASSSLFSARLTGPMTCSSAPVIQFMDLGVGTPGTIYSSATVLLSLTTGTTPGVYSNLTGSFTTVSGHWYGIALGSSTSCSVYPTFDISLYF